MKFSIITVTYNSENTIENTIKSVLNQKNVDYEYIIIDGGSSDKTIDIIESYKSKFGERLIVKSEKDEGPYDAMNKGIRMSTGDLLCFMNSDDEFNGNILETINDIYINNKNIDIYYGNVLYSEIDNDGNEIKTILNAEKNIKKIKKGMIFCHQSSFVKKELFNKIGGFNTKYKIAADWEFFVRAYINNATFIYINKIIAVFNAGGLSSNNYSYENHLIRKKYKFFKVVDYYYLCEVLKSNIKNLFKYRLWRLYRLLKKLRYRKNYRIDM